MLRISLDGVLDLLGRQVGAELIQVCHTYLLSNLRDGLFSVGRMILRGSLSENRFVEFDVLALQAGCPRSGGSDVRPLVGEDHHVAVLDAQRPIVNQFLKLGLNLLGVLGAHGARVIRVLDHHDGSVDLAARHRVVGIASWLIGQNLQRLLIGLRGSVVQLLLSGCGFRVFTLLRCRLVLCLRGRLALCL